jgi:hypothetical protein
MQLLCWMRNGRCCETWPKVVVLSMYRWATGWVTWVWFAAGVEIFSYCCYHNQTTSEAWSSLSVGDSCLLGQWPVYIANNSYTLELRLRMILRLWVRIALSIKLRSTSLPVHLRMGTDPVSISIKLSRYLTTFSSENGNRPSFHFHQAE